MKTQPHLCECGCGKPTKIATETRPERRHVKGQPMPRLQHHGFNRIPKGPRGTKHCNRCKKFKPVSEFGMNRYAPDGRQYRCYPCQVAYNEEWYAKNPGRHQNSVRMGKLARKHGLTPDDLAKMVKSQRGRCAICRKPEHRKNRDGSARPLSVDHHHDTGAVRGLLCLSCNNGLGLLGDSADNLRRALVYLRR